MRPTLDELGAHYGTDKQWAHGYTPTYDQYLTPLRDDSIRLLELGWGGEADPNVGGASARMWRDYFPNGEVHVVELHPKNMADENITLWKGSQNDPKFLQTVAEGEQFDIVLDDCSHVQSLTIRSFELLWPRVRPGGLYIVEDVHTAYQPAYGGHPDPDKGLATAMGFLKRCADQVNARVGASDYIRPGYVWLDVAMVAFHPGTVVVRKR
jgi:hypothetical protein